MLLARLLFSFTPPACTLALPFVELCDGKGAANMRDIQTQALHPALLYYTVKTLVHTPGTLSRHVLLCMKACSTLGLALVNKQSIIVCIRTL